MICVVDSSLHGVTARRTTELQYSCAGFHIVTAAITISIILLTSLVSRRRLLAPYHWENIVIHLQPKCFISDQCIVVDVFLTPRRFSTHFLNSAVSYPSAYSQEQNVSYAAIVCAQWMFSSSHSKEIHFRHN